MGVAAGAELQEGALVGHGAHDGCPPSRVLAWTVIEPSASAELTTWITRPSGAT